MAWEGIPTAAPGDAAQSILLSPGYRTHSLHTSIAFLVKCFDFGSSDKETLPFSSACGFLERQGLLRLAGIALGMGIQRGQAACHGDGMGTGEMGWVLKRWGLQGWAGDCRDGYHRAGLGISGIEWLLHGWTGYCSDGRWGGCWDNAHPCIHGAM